MRSDRRIEKAVVLAAGKGVRLWPLTENRSKHMIPVAGRPIVEHLLLAIRRAGIRDIVLVTAHQEEVLRRHLGDGSAYGVSLEYVHQSNISGTATAIRTARNEIAGEDFLLVYGDLVVTETGVRLVIERHRRAGYSATVGLVPTSDPSSYGMAHLSQGRLLEIVEKPLPSESPSELANAGVYVMTAALMEHLESTSETDRGEFEVTDAISSLARSGQPVAWVRLDASEWLDIGRPWDLLAANARLLGRSRRLIHGTVEKGATVTGRVTIQSGATIRSGTIIEGPAWIAGGAIIGPLAHIRPSTTVGEGAVVGNFCEVKNSVIMANAHIHHLSYVGDSLIGEGCNFGAGTVTANVKLNNRTVRMRIRDKLEDTGLRKLGVVMGDNVRTGINTSIMPGVRIASGAIVPSGRVVSEDIVLA